MTAFELPAPDAPASEWGRLAVSIPGFRWMPGMHDCWGRCAVSDAADGVQWVNPYNPADQCEPDHWPDPDDPATAGCLLALLGGQFTIRKRGPYALDWRGMAPLSPGTGDVMRTFGCCGDTLGRAVITAAATFGKWPGGGA